MKPLIILLAAFALALFAIKIQRNSIDVILAARIGMASMLLFTAIGHFLFTRGMTMMLPDLIPYKIFIIYSTGVLEVLAAVGLFIPGCRLLTGWFLIAFFVLALPANVYAAINHIDYQKGTMDGPGAVYLWFRIPLQILFVGLTYFIAIKKF
jgi:uncharacterized membrane protein